MRNNNGHCYLVTKDYLRAKEGYLHDLIPWEWNVRIGRWSDGKMCRNFSYNDVHIHYGSNDRIFRYVGINLHCEDGPAVYSEELMDASIRKNYWRTVSNI